MEARDFSRVSVHKSKRKAYEFLAKLAQFDDWKLEKAEDVFGNPLPDCLALYISREDYENTYKVETFHCSAILMGQEWERMQEEGYEL